MTTLAAAPLDDVDGQPTWSVEPGAALVEDNLAWERLGVGHRCETWLCWSVRLWSPVVVKVARPHQTQRSRTGDTLRREIAALRSNPHPQLPRLYSWDTGGARPHIVLEYVDGPALDEELDHSGPLDTVSTVLLGTQLFSAVGALHRRGIAHLDVKPENVVVRDGRPVLVDFGSARLIGTPQPAGKPVGTLGYAAPEMERCEPITAAMDVYGVGAVLAEAVGDPGDPRLAATIRALLAPEPAQRPTVGAALRRLATCVEGDQRPWPEWADGSG